MFQLKRSFTSGGPIHQRQVTSCIAKREIAIFLGGVVAVRIPIATKSGVEGQSLRNAYIVTAKELMRLDSLVRNYTPCNWNIDIHLLTIQKMHHPVCFRFI
mmetsp:Transcript_27529/g.40922  ORF Transcript_27529/g.40922 Transcript_27529/m.40922 type:complete len:101 (+) Transcript_27529:535-837(+)